jgi:hypothetical protein
VTFADETVNRHGIKQLIRKYAPAAYFRSYGRDRKMPTGKVRSQGFGLGSPSRSRSLDSNVLECRIKLRKLVGSEVQNLRG